MKRVVILGSAGSIGTNALRVVEALPDRLKVTGLAVERNVDKVLEQAARFGVKNVAVADPAAAARCACLAPAGLRVFSGPEGVRRLAALANCDIVLCAVVGMAGLAPVLAALNNGTDVALATKEVLVAAGKIVTTTAARRNARLLPVDSEHSAIFQCLGGECLTSGGQNRMAHVKRLILTASGGPFGMRPDMDLRRVTVAQTLKHPQWKMGRKVTVDSATLMNKGLEIIEAHWFFGLPLDSISVVIHPESIVHSAVEFVDGTILAQMSIPDMRFAIQYAFSCPDRLHGRLPRLDLVKAGNLRFSEPDEKRFPCLALARHAARTGGTMPAVLNAANEIAVRHFIAGQIPFPGIWRTVAKVMRKHRTVRNPELEEIIEADSWARKEAGERHA